MHGPVCQTKEKVESFFFMLTDVLYSYISNVASIMDVLLIPGLTAVKGPVLSEDKLLTGILVLLGLL